MMIRLSGSIAAALRIAVFVVIAGMGWWIAVGSHLRIGESADAYIRVVSLLLAVGLVASVHSIDLADAKQHRTVVLSAVTVGVLLKAVIIAAVMYTAFRQPAFLVLGIAVAQIDPLSFAALDDRDRTSPAVRTLLAAWSAFDDPITVLLTIYAGGWAVRWIGGSSTGSSLMDVSGGLGDFAGDLLRNLGLALVAYGIWRLTLLGGANVPRWRRARPVVQTVLLVALIVVAVWFFLMLGLALSALFFRPPIGPILNRLAGLAFHLATFALGMLLAAGINPLAGVVLGVAAYGAQFVAGMLIARRYPRRDRVAVGLGQQSGITAVLLALLLEESFPGTVAIVAPAIVVINVLHAVFNGRWGAEPRPLAVPQESVLKSASASVRTRADSPASTS
jgi:hypothetical protein